jgi:hypothetical protein
MMKKKTVQNPDLNVYKKGFLEYDDKDTHAEREYKKTNNF